MILAEAEDLIISGEPLRAYELLTALLEKEPSNAEALHLSGLASLAAQDMNEGIARLQLAVALRPDPSWLRDLGAACLVSGSADDATQWLKEAFRIDPSSPEGRVLLGEALTGCGRITDALAILEGIDDADRDLQTLRALGEASFAAKQLKPALAYFENACSLNPKSSVLHEWCAVLGLALCRFDGAVSHWRQIVALKPGECDALCGLSVALWCAGEMEACREVSSLAREAYPNDERGHTNWLRAVDHSSFDPAESRQAWEQWGEFSQLSRKAEGAWGDRNWDADRLLRVAYMVDEIHKRPNSYFIPPLLENHDRTSFQVFCYLTAPKVTDAMQDLERLNHTVRDLRLLSPEEIARQAGEDAIDILVNVSWEFRNRNVAVFGHRAAPVQIELPHYPATTGHPETDFILSDRWICPPGSENMYSEQVSRLDNSYMPWRLPEPAPPVTELPLLAVGHCTFGLFQKPSKLNRHVWDTVGELLRRVPSARLLVHNNSGDLEHPDQGTRARFDDELYRRGVTPERVRYVGVRSLTDHFCTIAECDIALDTFPYNGTTTTGDCLWMGVPVITLACQTHAGRVGLSMLSRLDLQEFAASTTAEYVELAASLSKDTIRLAALRHSLRSRMQASTVTNAKAVMSGIEREFRFIWQSLCQKHKGI
jgi:protein O-GlcNAc transferase